MLAANGFSVLLVGPLRPFLQELRTNLLQSGGIEVVFALDPESVLDLAVELRPNIVLLDRHWDQVDAGLFSDVVQALVPSVWILDVEGEILRRPEAAGGLEILRSVVAALDKAA